MKIFKDIDNMLMKLFYLYQKNPRRYRNIKQYNLTMRRLVSITDQSIEEGNILTKHNMFLNYITVNENGDHEYQEIKLKCYGMAKQSVKDNYL